MNSSNALPAKMFSVTIGVGCIGLAASAIGAIFDLPHALQSYLLAFVYWNGLSLGALGLLLLQYVTGGEWGRAIRRTVEAASLNLPIMALFSIPVFAGISRIFVWAVHPSARVNTDYLNAPFVIVRAIIYFAIWSVLSWRLRRLSLLRDNGSYSGNGCESVSGIGLVLYVLTVSFASIDWIMSLEPDWSSSIFGVLVMVGQGLAAMAGCIAVLRLAPAGDSLTDDVRHDLGNLSFMFVLLWGYMALSQYLVVWSGNLPEEIPWYLHRHEGGWTFVAGALILFHFALPFFLLLFRSVKRSKSRLYMVAVMILVIHFVDCYWLIMPAFRPEGPAPRWLDAAAMIGIGGIWIGMMTHWLNSAPLFVKESKTVEHGAAAHAGGSQ